MNVIEHTDELVRAIERTLGPLDGIQCIDAYPEGFLVHVQVVIVSAMPWHEANRGITAALAPIRASSPVPFTVRISHLQWSDPTFGRSAEDL